MIEQSRAVGPWREAIRAETQRVTGCEFITGPVHVVIQFWLPRPKSAKSGSLPAKRPDLDKLVRAVLDGVTEGGALADDGQVVRLGAEKTYATESMPPGCRIKIERVL
jgi:Holliday junction resolvase RusA-like endonuclease